MPTPVRLGQLSHVTPIDEVSLQIVHTCRFEGAIWFYKQPPAEVVETRARTIRILNEALCGTIVSFLNERSESTFLTPEYRLVIDDKGHPLGVISQMIPYTNFMNRGTGCKNLEQALLLGGLAEISTIRFILEDPDGNNNAGYDDEDKPTTLSSIDYGLANFSYLLANKALSETEARRLPERGAEVFDIGEENLLSCLVQSMGDDIEFLTHHAFFKSEKSLADIDAKNRPLIENFFEKIYGIKAIIAREFRTMDFKSQIFSRLGVEGLEPSQMIICHEILNALIERAEALTATIMKLSRYSPDELTRLVTRGTPEPRLSPCILEASPRLSACGIDPRQAIIDAVNRTIKSRADIEQLRQQHAGRVTMADGGGAGGYSSVLEPTVPTSPGFFGRSRAGSAPLDAFKLPPPMSASPSRF